MTHTDESDAVNILCNCDDNFAPWCGVMLTSALENLRGHHTVIHLINSGISEAQLSRFHLLQTRYDCTINVITPTAQQLSMLPASVNGWPRSSFVRVLAGELLPRKLGRVIYLDSDIAVDSSLMPLWTLSLEGCACAVVHDDPYLLDYTPRGERFGIKSRYFNSGVMVIDLDEFRRLDIFSRAAEMLRTATTEMDCPDQDVLNILLDGNHVDLPVRWNIKCCLYQTGCTDPDDEDKAEAQGVMNRKVRGIIHYIGHYKPWKNGLYDFYPLEQIWRGYYRKSLWADTPLQPASLSLRERIGRWRHAFAFRHGLPSAYSAYWRRY